MGSKQKGEGGNRRKRNECGQGNRATLIIAEAVMVGDGRTGVSPSYLSLVWRMKLFSGGLIPKPAEVCVVEILWDPRFHAKGRAEYGRRQFCTILPRIGLSEFNFQRQESTSPAGFLAVIERIHLPTALPIICQS